MRLLAFLLILLMAQGAGAVEIVDGMDGVPNDTGQPFFRSDADRFLSEKVQNHIDLGDSSLRCAPRMDHKEMIGNTYLDAIAHYLKALVLIEEEKMRKGK